MKDVRYVAIYNVGRGFKKSIDAREYDVSTPEHLDMFIDDLLNNTRRLICLKRLDDDQDGEEWLRTRAFSEIREAAKT